MSHKESGILALDRQRTTVPSSKYLYGRSLTGDLHNVDILMKLPDTEMREENKKILSEIQSKKEQADV